MKSIMESRRQFLKVTGLTAGAIVSTVSAWRAFAEQREAVTPDYMLHIKNSSIEIAPNRFVSVTTYNGQFPGPLLRFKEGQRVTIDIFNDTETPEQLHSFELTRLAGKPTAGILKDVVMLGGYGEAEVDFAADNPGLTLFHCHQQLHMDFGFMVLFDYV